MFRHVEDDLIRQDILRQLQPRVWLADETMGKVIDFLNQFNDGSFVLCDTHVTNILRGPSQDSQHQSKTLLDSTKNGQALSRHQKFIFALHQHDHWLCAEASFDPTANCWRFICFDSFGNAAHQAAFAELLTGLSDLKPFCDSKTFEPVFIPNRTIQRNSVSCGLYVLWIMFLRYVLFKARL